MIILNNKFVVVILPILLIFINLILVIAEIRTLDGQSNNKANPEAGTPQSQFTKNIGKTSWPDASGNAMASTPGEYTINVPTNTFCNTPLPNGQLPLPRCVSNLINGLQAKLGDEFNLTALEAKKSKKKTSHMVTFWGQFANLDIVNTASTGENLGIYIPPDDPNYISQYFVGPSNQPLTDTFLPFNRTIGPIRNGINRITSFLDGSLIYGVDDIESARVRDKEGGLGKFRLNYIDSDDGKFGYPLVDGVTGEYIFAIADHKGKNLFINTIMLILMREHNRKCDELYAQHKNQWSDEDYFQEARRWVIAIIQRITYLEYLSVVLGTPLPTYNGYNASLNPSIDSFFATVTSRYGHSELSDVYDIVNKDGAKLAELPLNALQTNNVLETYGVPTLILSLALQRQEEVDIFYADQMRAFRPIGKVQDIASLDIVRGRDRGVPFYNDAREAFGLGRAVEFSDISQDQEVQNRLQSTYGSVDLVESIIGGLAETHVQGSLIGPLFHSSFTQQWTLIRDSDRFWFEGTDAGFTPAEIDEIRNTTLLSVIQRNTPSDFNYPTNLWSVQPTVTFNATDNGNNYPSQNVIKLSEVYEVRWVIKGDQINLKLTMMSTNSWFGIGFNPLDTGMLDADMIIIWNKNDSSLYVKDYNSNGYKKPEVDSKNQFVTILSNSTSNGITQVEISRPLNAPNRRPITNTMITMIYAWNPNSMEFSYHGGNRGATKVNFFSGETSADVLQSQTLTRLIHGIAMFSVWGLVSPSIFIVRYLKHIDSYMSQHRNLQMLGGLIVITFGAAAMATVPQHGRNAHGICGLLVYFTLLIQIGLGILAIWGLASVESASTGIVVGLKHLHFYLGVILLFLSWCQIYLGLKQYGSVKAVYVLYLCWLAILVIMIVVSEYVYKYKNMQFLWPVRETGDKNRRLHNCIPEDVYEQLPAISWNDFNLRVMAGAHLVVAEGLVFDIHKWIKIHPGGQRILRRVIGTDITHDFFFDPADQIVINRAFSENEKLMKQIEEGETNNKKLKKKKGNLTLRPKSIANAIDMINSTTFKNSRVAMHRHSKFATSKLATMVVARISDLSDDYGQQKKDDYLNTPTNTTLTNTSQDNSPYIFRRYILTNIESVTRHDAENPVKKLTFQVLHPKDKLPKFLPGDYIEIMSYVNKHIVIRPYTPLQGPTDKTFTILVKIYNDGAMSQHLGKQLRNFEIAVRGPFDIAERMNVQSSLLQTNLSPTSPTIVPTSPNLVRRGTTLARKNSVNNVVINPHQSYQPSNFGLDSVFGDENRSVYGTNSNNGASQPRILLNPARGDQCWDVLFMVCGGTGLTPMLQLIQYHFDNADNFKSKFKLHLLCANTQISDIISMKYLDFLASTSDGKLTVTHILTKPPPIWRGLTGHIDDDILFNWISKFYQVPPPAIPPRINIPTMQTTNNPQYSQHSQNSSQVSLQSQPQMLLTAPYSPPPIANNYPTSSTPPPMDENYNWQIRDTLPSFIFSSNEMSILSERQEFMKILSQDTTQAYKVIVCGPYGMMEAVRRSLERIGFPIDTKALFIQ
ncbi:hypothetical protein RclHR1_10200006 [Rhizophagus clarus]|uniref:Peroxidase n=1 Tax=Rhizophagus clarus TaxID=94130 RepID=A0A2Z6QCT1_9GLOM|nr:hypothetical protein RclHR1_10200006 [Rhizophagus clarus]